MDTLLSFILSIATILGGIVAIIQLHKWISRGYFSRRAESNTHNSRENHSLSNLQEDENLFEVYPTLFYTAILAGVVWFTYIKYAKDPQEGFVTAIVMGVFLGGFVGMISALSLLLAPVLTICIYIAVLVISLKEQDAQLTFMLPAAILFLSMPWVYLKAWITGKKQL